MNLRSYKNWRLSKVNHDEIAVVIFKYALDAVDLRSAKRKPPIPKMAKIEKIRSCQ